MDEIEIQRRVSEKLKEYKINSAMYGKWLKETKCVHIDYEGINREILRHEKMLSNALKRLDNIKDEQLKHKKDLTYHSRIKKPARAIHKIRKEIKRIKELLCYYKNEYRNGD